MTHLRAYTACVFSAAIMLGSAAMPAQASSVRINANPGGGVDLAFGISCTFPDGQESEGAVYSVETGDYQDVEEDGCKNFNIWFKSPRGKEYSYRLKGGREYTFEWEGNRWDLVRN
jgi:hypothetical protein